MGPAPTKKPALRSVYTTQERADVRQQLGAYAKAHGLDKSSATFVDDIDKKLNGQAGFDHRRLRRFLNDTHLTSDTVIDQLVAYLNIVQQPYARLALEMARFFGWAEDREIGDASITEMREVIAGTYRVYLQGREQDAPVMGEPISPPDNAWDPDAPGPPFEIPYSIIKLDPIADLTYLSAFEQVGNYHRSPYRTEHGNFDPASLSARYTGFMIARNIPETFVLVLRRPFHLKEPKFYIVGLERPYPEDGPGPVLTGSFLEPNPVRESTIRGSGQDIKMVRQPGGSRAINS